MKKLTSAALMLLPFSAIFAQTTAYHIKATIGHDNAPAKAYLMYRTTTGSITDSVLIKNGVFEFKGTLPDPVKARLIVDHKGEGLRKIEKADELSIYLEPGEINIQSADSAYHAAIKAGTLNKENTVLQAVLKPFDNEQEKLSAELGAISKDKRTPELIAAYDKRFDASDAKQKIAVGSFLKTHTSTLVSLDALQTYGGYYPEASELAPIYDTFSASVKNSTAGKAYATLLAKLKLTAIGAQAPLFAQNDKDGNSISLASFKGKYVLIDFWASWCGPCRRENPNVVKAFNQFKDKNFTILGVSLDRPNGREKWLKAIYDDGLTWTQVSDLKFWNNEAAVLYGVRAIPQNLLLDTDGKIIAKNLFGQDLVNKLTKITGKKATTGGEE